MPFADLGQGVDPGRIVVECRNVMTSLATSGEEVPFAFLRNFLKGFEAISDKTRANDVDPPDTGLAQMRDQSAVGFGAVRQPAVSGVLR